MSSLSPERLEAAYQKALAALLAERAPEGHWVGELSTSALSTATAIMALALVQKHVPGAGPFDALITGGLDWLVRHQNEDGGWGDTVKSLSNISTTMLCRSAFYLTSAACGLALTDTTSAKPQAAPSYTASLRRAEDWLFQRHGNTPPQLAEAVRARYGKDRTFAVPILTTCALAGLVDWKEVPPLPFELACFPQSWFRLLRLHVVSYALPALIAIGQCVHHHRKPWNPFTRFIRWLSRKRSLRVLQKIQPSNGGFLEATPLTSFVTLSLAAIGQGDHPVARKGVEFIINSVRPDGSWPIDTNLSTWVTTLSINALAAAGELKKLDRPGIHYLPEPEPNRWRVVPRNIPYFEHMMDWINKQQYLHPHPYTGAAPGGWAWTNLPGGVPDADDTSGALLAVSNLCSGDGEDQFFDTPFLGLKWLFELQNSDGGWPTFCRGWGALPFDRSGCDLTAHVLRAIATWKRREKQMLEYVTTAPDHEWGWFLRDSFCKADEKIAEGLAYLAHQQRPDGSWLPLWFGNQHAPDDSNPTYGTARVLAAYRDLNRMNSEPAQRGVTWLLANQNADGGWGGCLGTPNSVEETALAVEILLDAGPDAKVAVNKGLRWLVEQVEAGGLQHPTPIGFYFARLWYFEKLYPMIFTVAALGRARRSLPRCQEPAYPNDQPS